MATPLRKAILVLLAVLAAAPSGRLWSGAATEHDLKAAFLFNLGRFVEWPKAEGRDSGGLTIAVVGADGIEAPLRALESGTVKGRKLRVMALRRDAASCGCHILFVGRQAGAQAARLVEAARAAGALVIGETADFVRSGGMMGLINDGGRLVIEINPDLMRKHGFRVDSQLLEIARLVRPAGQRPKG